MINTLSTFYEEVQQPIELFNNFIVKHALIDHVHVDALGLQPRNVRIELFEWDRKRQVIHRRVCGHEVRAGPAILRRDARRRLWRIGEPEKRDRGAVARVEEEVLAVVAQFERLHERHFEHVRVEVDRLLHVFADERHVIDAQILKPFRRHVASEDCPAVVNSMPHHVGSDAARRYS